MLCILYYNKKTKTQHDNTIWSVDGSLLGKENWAIYMQRHPFPSQALVGVGSCEKKCKGWHCEDSPLLAQVVKMLKEMTNLHCSWTSHRMSGKDRPASRQGPGQPSAGAGPRTPWAAVRRNGKLNRNNGHMRAPSSREITLGTFFVLLLVIKCQTKTRFQDREEDNYPACGFSSKSNQQTQQLLCILCSKKNLDFSPPASTLIFSQLNDKFESRNCI